MGNPKILRALTGKAGLLLFQCPKYVRPKASSAYTLPFPSYWLPFLRFNRSSPWWPSQLQTNLVQSPSHFGTHRDKAKLPLVTLWAPSRAHSRLIWAAQQGFLCHHNTTFQLDENQAASPRKQQTMPLTTYTTELRKQSSHFLIPSPPSSSAGSLRPPPPHPHGICCFCVFVTMTILVSICPKMIKC